MEPNTDHGTITRALAAQELLERKRARETLLAFTGYTMPAFQAATHHERIATPLEQVMRGEIDRLMIFAPPRHTKTELASKRFPAWYLGRHPSRQVIAAAYSKDLAYDYGRAVRNIVASPEFENLFPNVHLAQDSKAADRWNTDHDGVFIASGVDGPITGRGAHLAIIDDPLKGRQEADSEARRDLIWRWYQGDLRPRLMPGGAIVLIQTRWHEDDLAGRLLEQAKATGENWHLVDLPAICSDGTALWPEWYPLEELRRTQRDVGVREWNSLYMQRPTAEQGSYFQRKWFRFYKELPEELRKYGASDYAVMDDAGDWTVHAIGGVDTKGDLYIIDMWREQTTTDQWVESCIDLAALHKPILWGEEDGQIRKSVGPFLVKRMDERQVYFARKQYQPVTDKASRARSFQGRMAAGKVLFPEWAPWMAATMHEMLAFPAGANDDIVDTLGMFGRMMDELFPAENKDKQAADRELLIRLRRGIR